MSPAGSAGPLVANLADVVGVAEVSEPLPPHDFSVQRTCRYCHLPQEAVDDGFIDAGCTKRAEWVATYGEPA